MIITRHELYLEACKYAIEEREGSDGFFVITRDGKRHFVLWSKVIEWLNNELKNAENKQEDENDN